MVLGRDVVEGPGAAVSATVSGRHGATEAEAQAVDALFLYPWLVPGIGLALALLIWGAVGGGRRLAGFEVEEAGHFSRLRCTTVTPAGAMAGGGGRLDNKESQIERMVAVE